MEKAANSVYLKKVPEAAVLRGCLAYLRLKNICHWRQNTGSVKIEERYVQFGEKGLADIIGILPDGKFLAVECKSAKGTQTIHQRNFQLIVERSGGVYLLVKDAQHLVNFIESYKGSSISPLPQGRGVPLAR